MRFEPYMPSLYGELNGHNMFDMPDFDYDDGYNDDEDAGSNYNNTKTCKHCGMTGFQWKKTKDGWRLANSNGKLHDCPKFGGKDKTDTDIERENEYYEYVAGLCGDYVEEWAISQLANDLKLRDDRISELKDTIIKLKNNINE